MKNRFLSMMCVGLLGVSMTVGGISIGSDAYARKKPVKLPDMETLCKYQEGTMRCHPTRPVAGCIGPNGRPAVCPIPNPGVNPEGRALEDWKKHCKPGTTFTKKGGVVVQCPNKGGSSSSTSGGSSYGGTGYSGSGGTTSGGYGISNY